jgi:hypothetical protein
MKVGDKCPQCKEGLVERTSIGLACSECSWDMTVADVERENERARLQRGDYKFRGAKLSVHIDEPEEAEKFLRGLILARQNNDSEYFVDLIEGVNSVLEPWRAATLLAEISARG